MVWKVVKTYDGQDLAFHTVPKSWITLYEGENFVHYPPPGTFPDLTKAIVAQKEKADNWKDYPAEVIPNDFEKYFDARSVEAKVVDVEEKEWKIYLRFGFPVMEYGTGKRGGVKKNQRYPGEKSTTEHESSDESTAEEQSNSFPSPPVKDSTTALQKTVKDAKKQLFIRSTPASPEKSVDKQRSKSTDPIPKRSSDADMYDDPTPGTSKRPVPKQTTSNRNSSEDSTAQKKLPRPSEAATPKSKRTPKKNAIPAVSPRATPKRKSQSADKTASPRTTPKRNAAISASNALRGNRKQDALNKGGHPSGALDVEVDRIIIDGDAELAAALNLNQEKVADMPVDDTGPGRSGKRHSAGDLLLYLTKKFAGFEKKLDLLLTNKSNAENQLKFSIPCKDSKRLIAAEKVITTDQPQYDVLVAALAAHPNPATRVIAIVNAILRHVMMDGAAKKFCYTGSNNKYEFKSMKMCQAVIDAVHVVKSREETSSELIGKSIAAWFSQAKRRLQNRASKATDNAVKKKPKKPTPKTAEEMETSESE